MQSFHNSISFLDSNIVQYAAAFPSFLPSLKKLRPHVLYTFRTFKTISEEISTRGALHRPKLGFPITVNV